MNIDDKIEIALGFIDSGQYQKAVDYLTEIIEINNSDERLFLHRGYAYLCLIDTDSAETDLNTTIGMNDHEDSAYWYLSQIHTLRNNYQKAEECILAALQIDNENVNYITDYALIEQQLKNYPKSIELCEILLSDDPTDPIALNTRGYSHLMLKDYDSAIADFESALNENPNDYFVLNNLGLTFIQKKELEKANKYLQLAIKTQPYFAHPYNNIGFIRYLENDFDSALLHINKSIELDPRNSLAYKNRALVYIGLNDKEKASHDLIHAKELKYSEEYDNEVDELLKTNI